MSTKTATPPAAYRVGSSVSADLAIPADAPHTPPAVRAASDLLVARVEDCEKRARALREKRNELLGGVEKGNPRLELARPHLIPLEQAYEGAVADWRWAVRELVGEVAAARDAWVEKLDVEAQKIRDRMAARIDELQADFDEVEQLEFLKHGLSEIPEPGAGVDGLRLNCSDDLPYRAGQRRRVREWVMEHGVSSTVASDADSLIDALR